MMGNILRSFSFCIVLCQSAIPAQANDFFEGLAKGLGGAIANEVGKRIQQDMRKKRQQRQGQRQGQRQSTPQRQVAVASRRQSNNVICAVGRGQELRDRESCSVESICYSDGKCDNIFKWPTGSQTLVSAWPNGKLQVNGNRAENVKFRGYDCFLNKGSGNTFCGVVDDGYGRDSQGNVILPLPSQLAQSGAFDSNSPSSDQFIQNDDADGISPVVRELAGKLGREELKSNQDDDLIVRNDDLIAQDDLEIRNDLVEQEVDEVTGSENR